ncbi:hypothetical protein TBR22_A22430 [Luteitalea sp. TBR-22]|uniref:DUF1684 domain-containing protein n=1 Tax=Luteitalea sp. TBR-22 TaxID=2802971 RepID=UPI001AF4B5E7|nr:DUF1684 domain-containing protein [Luteitalea sp. TBR-22]BCS33018.1 hypothetical protein TBR22_A22430 [Luteitalea sp. TBR-22]
MTLSRSFSVAALAALLLASPVLAQEAAGAFPPGNPPGVDDWRQQYEQTLRDEYGWLSVAGLTFLPDGTYVIGSAPGSDIPLPTGHAPAKVGTVVVAGGVATLRFEPGVEALLNGQPAPAEVVLKKAERGAPGQPATPPDKVRVGKVEFHLHESGPRLAMRVRDPESPIRIGFQGPKWFPVSEGARVVATLRPFEEARTVDVRNILGDPEPYQAPGQLEFPWDGKKVRVLAFTSTKGRLQVIFRDATMGRETYGTRYVYAEPTGDGRYVIDFNRAYNPPCAYNPYTTCPTPPKENILKVAIRAGEKIYDGPTTHAAR